MLHKGEIETAKPSFETWRSVAVGGAPRFDRRGNPPVDQGVELGALLFPKRIKPDDALLGCGFEEDDFAIRLDVCQPPNEVIIQKAVRIDQAKTFSIANHLASNPFD